MAISTYVGNSQNTAELGVALSKRPKLNNFYALVYAWKKTKSHHLSSSLKFQFTGISAAQGQRVQGGGGRQLVELYIAIYVEIYIEL